MDRYTELLNKEKTGSLTPEESDELFELREEEFESGMSESERVGMTQTQWGWM
jgi:uncharacterized protein YnzC (UPF0291/DUF896 family)